MNAKNLIKLTLLVSLLMLGLLITQTTTAQAPITHTWRIECITCPKYLGPMSNRKLTLDADEYPDIIYGGDHLYYAYHDGSLWYIETVDAMPYEVGHAALTLDSIGVCFPRFRRDRLSTQLALDRAHHLHISYHTDTNDDLKYAYYDGVQWQIETVDSIDNTGGYRS